MKKTLLTLASVLVISFSQLGMAVECDPGLKPDFKLNTGTFDAEQFKRDNKPDEDTAGSVMLCFMGTTSGGMSPTKVFNDTCGCKENIKKHCSIKKKKLRASGVPIEWCAPFYPFL